MRLDDFLGRDDVAERLRHLLRRFVEDQAMRQDARDTAPAAASPTAVISDTWNQPRCWSTASTYRSAGHARSGALAQHRLVRAAGIEPDVEDVVVLLEVVAAAAARESGWQQLARRAARTTRPSRARGRCARRARSPPARTMNVLQLRQRKAGIGTPQARWRDRHQSGRVCIML